MLKKIIAGLLLKEREVFANIKAGNLPPNAEPSKFTDKINTPCYNLTFIYPLKDQELIAEFLKVQQQIRNILQDGAHYYQTSQDFHMTMLEYLHKDSLSTEDQIQTRNTARSMMIGGHKENLLIVPRIRFFGGCATRTAVIIHGYNFAGLNESRLKFAQYGLRKNIFPEDKASQILEGNVYPNIAHLSLIQFRNPVSVPVRQKINEFLNNRFFTKDATLFSELGLYEFHQYGIFSNGLNIDKLILAER